jgi:hypothetical protein
MTTKRKRLAWICLLVSPLVLGGAAFCLSDRDPITQANCDRIKKGMSLKEVEDLLEKQPPSLIDGGASSGIVVWRGARGRICVSYSGPFMFLDSPDDSPNLVIHAVFTPDSRTILDKLRNWLGW